APPLPIITLPFATRGAPVIEYLKRESTVSVSQIGLPVAASSATNRPSSVPTNTLPFHTATPRLTPSQHALTPHSRGTFGSSDHSNSPVPALSAKTLLQALVKYITPSTTTGVAS